MDEALLKKYFSTEVKIAGLESGDLDSRLEAAIQIGLHDFWGAYDWKFKLKMIDFTVATTANSYVLPNEFGGMKSIVESSSSTGMRLLFLEKEEFDRMIANPTAWATGYPTHYTLFRDMNEAGAVISFYPRPAAGTTFDILMYQALPGSSADVPQEYSAGLVSCIAKYIYPIGSEGRSNAAREYYFNLERLKLMDKINKGKIFRFTAADDAPERVLPWL